MTMETGQDSDNEHLPLRLDEIRVYLAEWLSRRQDGADAFSEDQIRQIHQVSGGRLDRIEQLARQCLTDPAMQPEDSSAKNSPLTITVVTGVAVVTILAVIMLLSPAPERKDSTGGPSQAEIRAEPGRSPATTEPDTTVKATRSPVLSDGAREEKVLLSGVRTRDWLMQEDGSQYVLQLVGAREVKTIGNFVAGAAIHEHELTLLRSRRNGEDWYTLIYGLYPDAETARRERQKLSRYARDHNPWPRLLSEVLEESYR
ncbi:MAG: hypothetical protein WD750_06770 [Gammaproteobacteria bacterium]